MDLYNFYVMQKEFLLQDTCVVCAFPDSCTVDIENESIIILGVYEHSELQPALRQQPEMKQLNITN